MAPISKILACFTVEERFPAWEAEGRSSLCQCPREAPGPSMWQGLRPFSSCWTGWQSVAPGSGPHQWLERRRVNTCQIPRPSAGTTLSSDPPGASAGLHGIPLQLPTAVSTPDARFSGRLDLADSPHTLSAAHPGSPPRENARTWTRSQGLPPREPERREIVSKSPRGAPEILLPLSPKTEKPFSKPSTSPRNSACAGLTPSNSTCQSCYRG